MNRFAHLVALALLLTGLAALPATAADEDLPPCGHIQPGLVASPDALRLKLGDSKSVDLAANDTYAEREEPRVTLPPQRLPAGLDLTLEGTTLIAEVAETYTARRWVHVSYRLRDGRSCVRRDGTVGRLTTADEITLEINGGRLRVWRSWVRLSVGESKTVTIKATMPLLRLRAMDRVGAFPRYRVAEREGIRIVCEPSTCHLKATHRAERRSTVWLPILGIAKHSGTGQRMVGLSAIKVRIRR